MNALSLPGEPVNAFDHLAGYGLAAILESTGARVSLAWSDELETRLLLHGVGWDSAGRAVLEHAQRAADESSWVMKDGTNRGATRGLFSPRVAAMVDAEVAQWYARRHDVLDSLTSAGARLDLAMIGGLGEPAYWYFDRDSPRPDNGASRWEMKTRNRGEEFVANRLRILARTVAARDLTAVVAGLQGVRLVDEAGKYKQDSRTPTGLMPPRPVDNARAWCALWGISMFAVVHRRTGASRTAGHSGHHGTGMLHLPVMTAPWPASRLRTVLRSARFHTAASGTLPTGAAASAAQTGAAWEWLKRRGASTIVSFPVFRSANASAPEKWAERGELVYAG